VSDQVDAAADAGIPAPPWQRLPERPARRRREPISRGAIVEAAVRLLDREGLDALSMRRVAEELGTGAASLYWHVGSKDGLLDLVFDYVIGEQVVPDPDPGHWQEQIKDVARSQRAICLRHPYVVQISIGRIPMGPNALRYSERVLAILRGGGVPDGLAVQSYLLLISAVNGFMLDETGDAGGGESAAGAPGPGAPERGAPERGALGPGAQEMADMASAYLASLPADRFPNMVALAGEFSLADPGERFELLLDIFVGGIERRAAALSS
jgi:AcrR family transcriptional regulator